MFMDIFFRIGLFLLMAAPALGDPPAAPTAVGTTNRVVMVDQDGVFNVDVLATQAQLSTNAAAAVIAEAKAEAAAAAAAEGTNMIDGIVAQIAASELVIYRQGHIDGITSDIGLPPDTLCAITAFEPNTASSGGMVSHTVTYATSRAADGCVPDVLYTESLTNGGVRAMEVLPASRVSPVRRKGETWTSPDGTVFPSVYEVDVTVPASASGFFIIHLDGDASASGAVFDIRGGISGGATTNAVFGDKVLHFTGGLLTSVGEAP